MPTAFTAKARAECRPSSRPPSGRPRNSWAVISAVRRWPLARTSAVRGTSCGSALSAAVSYSTSTVPSSREPISSVGNVSPPVSASTAKEVHSTTRTRLAAAIVCNRGQRSTRTPAGIATSHGSLLAAAVAATQNALSVTVVASHGSTMKETPSARFEVRNALQSRQKGRPSLPSADNAGPYRAGPAPAGDAAPGSAVRRRSSEGECVCARRAVIPVGFPS